MNSFNVALDIKYVAFAQLVHHVVIREELIPRFSTVEKLLNPRRKIAFPRPRYYSKAHALPARIKCTEKKMFFAFEVCRFNAISLKYKNAYFNAFYNMLNVEFGFIKEF